MISGLLARFSGGRATRGALSVATSATSHGHLRMEVAYACADQDEPVILEIIVRKPRRVVAVCESLRSWTINEELGWKVVAKADMDRARRAKAPMVLDRPLGQATTTAYLADFGEGYRYSVSSGEVTLRVIDATSGRCLLSRRMTIEPA